MIVNLRGTNGSGKSTAVRFFLDKIEGGLESMEKHYVDGRKNPLYYTHPVHGFALIGHYETQCGGADTISSYKTLTDLCLDLHNNEGINPVVEGVLISTDTKQFKMMHEHVEDIRIIYLTTPFEQCVKNIENRRAESGRTNKKPLNTDNTLSKFKTAEATRSKLLDEGILCRRAPVEQAAEIMYDWLINND